MNRAQKIAAEPQMEDILASIKRAIGGEEALASESRLGDMEPRLADNPLRARAITDGGKTASVVPVTRGTGRDLRMQRMRESERDTRSATSEEILHLRSKIARELTMQERPPAPQPADLRRAEDEEIDRAGGKRKLPLRQAASLFRSLLGGEEEETTDESLFEPLSPPPSSPAPTLRGALPEENRAYLRPVQKPLERAIPLNMVAVHERPAEHLRSAFDEPAPNSPGIRPPFGQGNMGIGSYSPPAQVPDMGARNAFGHQSDGELDQSDELTLNELARELLHPMLSQWLDRYLPGLVEEVARELIERVSRRGLR